MARRRGGVNWIVGCSLKSLEAEIIVYIGVRGDWIGLDWRGAVPFVALNLIFCNNFTFTNAGYMDGVFISRRRCKCRGWHISVVELYNVPLPACGPWIGI